MLAVAGAALCYGASVIFQAIGVERARSSALAGFVRGLAADSRYLTGMALTAAGFVLSLFAIRSLPLFVVQAGRASSLGVTAVLAALVLDARLRRREKAAVLGVVLGLVAVAGAAQEQGPAHVSDAVRWTILAAALAGATFIGLSARFGRGSARDRRPATVLALVAGSCFGLLALCVRVLGPITLPDLLTDPSAYAGGVISLTGLVGSALALQRGHVVAVTTTIVATEAVLGSMLGVAVGDRPADGRAWLAVLGFAVTIVCALLLARFGSAVEVVDELAVETAQGERIR